MIAAAIMMNSSVQGIYFRPRVDNQGERSAFLSPDHTCELSVITAGG